MKKIKYQINIETSIANIDPLSLFAHLSDKGRREGCSFFEIQDQRSVYSGFFIAVCSSSLALEGKKDTFHFRALTDLGRHVLTQLQKNNALKKATQEGNVLYGSLNPDLSSCEFEARLHADNHRKFIELLLPEIIFPKDAPNLPIGLTGCFGFDFVKQIELLPETNDSLNDPDYCFYVPEELFIYDSNRGELHLVTLCATAKTKLDNTFFEKAKVLIGKSFSFQPCDTKDLSCTLDKKTYSEKFDVIKNEILSGNVFQLVYGALFKGNFSGSALTAFYELRKKNPSDFMFYFHDRQGILMGASPESCLRIQSGIAMLTPIAGTMPRDQNKNIDQCFTINLLTNAKELAEHTMLLDLARNDLCSICLPGSVSINNAFQIKRYPHIQHLVSHVSGTLNPNLSPLQAYQATMNMGTLTGSPKPRALKLIAELENDSRGYFGGGFGMITHDGNMETCIVIRSLRIKNDKIYCRAASGIVLDSLMEAEFNEIQLKAKSCLGGCHQSPLHEA